MEYMVDEISKEDYLMLCKEYPLFKKIGHEGFGVKTWLVFKALNEGYVNGDSVASKPCQSLMEHKIPFHQIKQYLDDLKDSEMFLLQTGRMQYVLNADNSYELHRICYELGKKITDNRTPLKHLITTCGYTYDARNRDLVTNFQNSDVNAKADTLKDLLSQLAFAGARLLVKIVVKMEEKVD